MDSWPSRRTLLFFKSIPPPLFVSPHRKVHLSPLGNVVVVSFSLFYPASAIAFLRLYPTVSQRRLRHWDISNFHQSSLLPFSLLVHWIGYTRRTPGTFRLGIKLLAKYEVLYENKSKSVSRLDSLRESNLNFVTSMSLFLDIDAIEPTRMRALYFNTLWSWLAFFQYSDYPYFLPKLVTHSC